MPRPGVILVNGIVYASAYLGISLMTYVVGSWITYFYAPPVDSGLLVRLSPALVGAAVALGRIVDALSIPRRGLERSAFESVGQAHPLSQAIRRPSCTHLRAPLDPVRFTRHERRLSLSNSSPQPFLCLLHPLCRPVPRPPPGARPVDQGTHRLVGLAGTLQHRGDRDRRTWGRPPHSIGGLWDDGRGIGRHLAGQPSPTCLDP